MWLHLAGAGMEKRFALAGAGMEKRFALAGILAACLALAACGGPGPSKVTRQFFAAVEKGDVGQLPKYATAETVATARTFAGKAKGYVAAKGGIASTEEAIDGKRAVVTVKFKDGSTEKIDLVKVKGQWKVSIKK
jgi:hypothetical protein